MTKNLSFKKNIYLKYFLTFSNTHPQENYHLYPLYANDILLHIKINVCIIFIFRIQIAISLTRNIFKSQNVILMYIYLSIMIKNHVIWDKYIFERLFCF